MRVDASTRALDSRIHFRRPPAATSAGTSEFERRLFAPLGMAIGDAVNKAAEDVLCPYGHNGGSSIGGVAEFVSY